MTHPMYAMDTIARSQQKWWGVMDKSYVDKFSYDIGVTPVSTISEVVIIIAVYLSLVFGIKQWITHRGKPFDLRRFSAGFNALLSVGSLATLIVLVTEMTSMVAEHGLWPMLCDQNIQFTRGPKTFIMTFILYTKVFELSDTMLLCLRGKATPFLHVYHHAITVFFAWLHMREQTCVAWTMPILNLLVHVFLYAYFALHELGHNVWWKRYLTMMQITQFYTMLIPSLVVLMPRVIFTINPELPFAAPCHGSWTGVFAGVPILLSYLYLFQRLYNTTYKKPSGAVAPANGSAKPDLKSALKKEEVAFDPAALRSSTMWGKTGSASELKRREWQAAAAKTKA